MFKRILLWVVIVLVILFFLSPFFSLSEGFRCLAVRHSVLAALDQASSVQVVEHSDRWDLAYNPDYKEKIYATITLTPKQIDDLRNALPFSLDFDGGILKCIFEEHHRIEITEPDGTVTTLHLCFHCGQLYVGRMNKDYTYYGTMPPGWTASLRQFVTSMGLHPDGPWDTNPDAQK